MCICVCVCVCVHVFVCVYVCVCLCLQTQEFSGVLSGLSGRQCCRLAVNTVAVKTETSASIKITVYLLGRVCEWDTSSPHEKGLR